MKTEMYSTNYYVHIRPLDLWLYDPSTEKVIAKLMRFTVPTLPVLSLIRSPTSGISPLT
ncbi:MAG TPA: hypothetical protein VNE63_15365 [Candidatus Acidoferrales bacterium]|nr:hypothetical protein [Candidatus Acidoferrales bacterium]